MTSWNDQMQYTRTFIERLLLYIHLKNLFDTFTYYINAKYLPVLITFKIQLFKFKQYNFSV